MHWKSSSHLYPIHRVWWLCSTTKLELHFPEFSSLCGSVFTSVRRNICMSFGSQKWRSNYTVYTLKIMQGACHWDSSGCHWSVGLVGLRQHPDPHLLQSPTHLPLQLLWILGQACVQLCGEKHQVLLQVTHTWHWSWRWENTTWLPFGPCGF